MQSFLQQIAGHLQKNFEGQYENVAVILPTQRSKHFLINELTKDVEKPFFLPALFTIGDFVARLSPYKRADKGDLLIDLYSLALETNNTKEDDFAKFVSWATMFLQDINDIDMQLKNPDDIFANLANVKELDINLFKDPSQKSEKKKKYLDFYYSLGNLYHKLQTRLKEKKCGYNGLIYRDVAENIANYSQKMGFKMYLFAGFNAFSPAEAAIVKHYIGAGQAAVFFDLDSFYYNQVLPDKLPPFSRDVSDLIHLTVSRLGLTERDVCFVGNHFREMADKRICVTGVSNGFQQVQYAVEVLKKLEGELDRTALVFADESLIVPFLHIYDCSKVNLTMGYPIQGTPLYNLMLQVINLRKNAQRMASGDGEALYYHRDLLAFFRNPIMKKVLFASGADCENFIRDFIAQNFITISAGDLNGVIAESEAFSPDFKSHITGFFSSLKGQGRAAFDALLALFKLLNSFAPDDWRVTRSVWQMLPFFVTKLEEVGQLLDKFPADINLSADVLEIFINDKFSGVALPLEGNRDKGLQVMGMLETRALDFDNVIILSVNEDVLPVAKSQNSLIIFDVKKFFGLPTYHENEAVSAYHFFRLLQRAKNVHLIYDTATTDTAIREKSRFIDQLKFEKLRQKAQFEFFEGNTCPEPQLNTDNSLEISKNNDIVKELAGMKYSPTALTTYITCRLQFFFKYVAKIAPPQDISEDIDSSIIGTVTHAVFESVFNRLRDNQDNLTQDIVNEIFDDVNRNLEAKMYAAFKVAFYDKGIKNFNLTRGKGFLTKVITENYIRSYLDKFKNECVQIEDFTGAENKCEAVLDVDGSKIRLRGTVDRIETRKGNMTYILDYKTGKAEAGDFKTANLVNVTADPKYKQLLQLFMYAYLVKNNDKEGGKTAELPYKCGIVSLQKAMSGTVPNLMLDDDVTEKNLDSFAEKLRDLFREILNVNVGFAQTEETDHCKYCDYAAVCGRESDSH